MKSTTLVLVNRRTKLGERIGIVAVIVPDSFSRPGIWRARSITARLTSSSVTVILFFSPISEEHKAEPDPPIGDLAVLFLGSLFRRVLVGKGLAAGLHLGLD